MLFVAVDAEGSNIKMIAGPAMFVSAHLAILALRSYMDSLQPFAEIVKLMMKPGASLEQTPLGTIPPSRINL